MTGFQSAGEPRLPCRSQSMVGTVFLFDAVAGEAVHKHLDGNHDEHHAHHPFQGDCPFFSQQTQELLGDEKHHSGEDQAVTMAPA